MGEEAKDAQTLPSERSSDWYWGMSALLLRLMCYKRRNYDSKERPDMLEIMQLANSVFENETRARTCQKHATNYPSLFHEWFNLAFAFSFPQ